MKIAHARARTIRIPFRFAFAHSLAAHTRSDGVLVHVVTDAGAEGYGEAVPRPYVTGETVDETVRDAAALAARLGGERFESAFAIDRWLGAQRAAASVCCATELALLDAFAREAGVPVLRLLGTPARTSLEHSAVIPMGLGPGLDRALTTARALGLRQIKLKVGSDAGHDAGLLRRAREVLGPAAEIRVDANGAWTLDEAKARLPSLLDAEVVAVEQPLSASSRGDYPALVASFGGALRIVVDEGLCTQDDARWFSENRAATAFNLKVSKLGGLFPALRVHAFARARGIACQLGAHVGETSILASAGRILGALSGDLFAHEGSYAAILLEHDLTTTPLGWGLGGQGAVADVDTRAGLGPQIDPELVERAVSAPR